jgi:hypothetical protein
MVKCDFFDVRTEFLDIISTSPNYRALKTTHRLREKLTATQPANKFRAIYRAQRFNTMFTTGRHWSLSIPSHSTNVSKSKNRMWRCKDVEGLGKRTRNTDLLKLHML